MLENGENKQPEFVVKRINNQVISLKATVQTIPNNVLI